MVLFVVLFVFLMTMMLAGFCWFLLTSWFNCNLFFQLSSCSLNYWQRVLYHYLLFFQSLLSDHTYLDAYRKSVFFVYLGLMFIFVNYLDAFGVLFCILVSLSSFAICWYMLVDRLTT